MRIGLVAEYSGNPDEGMKNVALHLARELSNRHEVIMLDLKNITVRFWRDARNFQPNIIHYIPGPTLISLTIAKALALLSKGARVVMSAPHPSFPPFPFTTLVSWLKPDLVLTQSHKSMRLFTRLGCKTQFWSPGVDTEKFIPAPSEVKDRLREMYGIDERKFVVLHVGHITKSRNLEFFEKVQGDSQVIIVASTSVKAEPRLQHSLQQRGCLVWRKYFENVEQLYALSDCYLFPTTNRIGSSEVPLSVMEAMSCNLPVITTRFGALPQLFTEGEGLFFADNEEQLAYRLSTIKNFKEIKTREKVLPYSWQNITRQLEGIYEEAMGKGRAQ
jgi:glycosyltransferase involved in cell wall biosynthesis